MEEENISISHEIINDVLNEFGGNWRTVEDLVRQPDSESNMRLLQEYFQDLDISTMSRDELIENIEANDWNRINGDEIDSPVVVQKFLSAVLHFGLDEAIRLVQQITEITFIDGIMGPQTVRAINNLDENEFIKRYQKEIRNLSNLNMSSINQNTAQDIDDTIDSFSSSVNTQQQIPNVDSNKSFKNSTVNEWDSINPEDDEFNVDAIAKKSTSDVWTIKDQLGYESYAQAIAKMIVDGKAEPPLTVSIQAPWGQGKTSLMRMIKHKLEHGLKTTVQPQSQEKTDEAQDIPGTQARLNDLDNWIQNEKEVTIQSDAMLKTESGTLPCVWFNPLYFQNSKQIWSGLAHVILYQLADKLDNQLEKERFWFRLRLTRINTRAIRRDIHKLILERLLPKGLIWFGILLMMLIIPQFFNDAKLLSTNSLFTGLPVVLGALIHGFLIWFQKNKDWALDDKLTKYINEPDYEGDLGLLHLIEHDLDRALELLLGDEGRLVVFIDDLDRCTPDTVNDILLAINQFISVQNRKLYFILGMDTHMVAMAIETAAEKQAETYNKNRHSSKGFGWRFMEKFVQLPFFIPSIAPKEAKKFLNDLLKTEHGKITPSEQLNELKKNIEESNSLPELQDMVIKFKSEHNVDFIPDVDATVASKMIDMTSNEDSDTFAKLISAAMEDLELNPREMKRFLNVARLLFIRIDHHEDVSSYNHMLKVVRASHLVLNWPQCLRWLQGNARSYTLKGIKTNPVDSIESLFDKKKTLDYVAWCDAIKETWGETVANTVAQPDFYAFAKRIHQNRPNLKDLFTARFF